METLKTFNGNCAKSIAITFISTFLSISVFSQQGPPTVKYPDVNGQNLLQLNDLFKIGSMMQVDNLPFPDTSLLHGNPPFYYYVISNGKGKFFKSQQKYIPGKTDIVIPDPGGAPCQPLSARKFGNTFTLCDVTSNFAIGTTTFIPGFKFIVQGNSFLNGLVETGELNVNGAATISGNTAIGGPGSFKYRFQVTGPENDGDKAAVRITSFSENMLLDGNEIDSDHTLFLNNHSSTDIVLASGGGNVGVGTTIIPLEKFHVSGGNILLDSDFYLKSKRDGHIVNLIGVTEGLPLPPNSATGPSASIITIGESTTFPAEVRIYTPIDNGQGVSIYNDQTRLVFFRNDGFVDIAGTLRACTLKANLTGGGCDYVFYEGYKKDELAYVKLYTKKYHHLPGVQSAKEMKKDGLNVSNMFTTLLKKIEEIFLHLFDFDKAIKGLNDTVDNLFKNDQAMEMKIDKLEKEKKELKKDNRELRENYSDLLKRVEALEEKVE